MLRFLQIWASSVMTGMFCVLKETARMVCTLRWWIYSGLSNSFKKQNNKEGFTVADCAWNVGAGRCHKGYFPFFFFFPLFYLFVWYFGIFLLPVQADCTSTIVFSEVDLDDSLLFYWRSDLLFFRKSDPVMKIDWKSGLSFLCHRPCVGLAWTGCLILTAAVFRVKFEVLIYSFNLFKNTCIHHVWDTEM